MEILRICHIAFAEFDLDMRCGWIVVGAFLAGTTAPTSDIKRQHLTSSHVARFIQPYKKMRAFLNSGLVPVIPVLVFPQKIRGIYIAPQIGICCPGAMYQNSYRFNGNLICRNA